MSNSVEQEWSKIASMLESRERDCRSLANFSRRPGGPSPFSSLSLCRGSLRQSCYHHPCLLRFASRLRLICEWCSATDALDEEHLGIQVVR